MKEEKRLGHDDRINLQAGNKKETEASRCFRDGNRVKRLLKQARI